MNKPLSRREFVMAGAALLARLPEPEPVVDIHQHTHYAGRMDEALLQHQKTLGITKTVLLPAGSKLGLDADCFGNDSVMALTKLEPKRFVFFANEVTDLPEAKAVLEKYLKLGAVGIGEQKFPVDCDSPGSHLVAQIADYFQVPILLHFQHNKYNNSFLRFHKMLEKYPRVRFIGHAQTWWGNIDKRHVQDILYPKGKVVPGGYTDRLLSDYPNMYGDLSAGSGLNALLRDEEHAAAFLVRHSKKLMYGSDCDDHIGSGEKCSGSVCLTTVRRLVKDERALREILSGTAGRVIRGVRI